MTAVTATAVITAGMAFTMVIMVVAPDIGIEVQNTGKERFHRFVVWLQIQIILRYFHLHLQSLV